MTVCHHPADARLLAYATGNLDAGEHLVLSTHLDGCPSCRQAIAVLDHVGGTLLADLEPAAMTADARARVMARLDDPAAPATRPPLANDMMELPERLRCFPLGQWQWAGPGTHWRTVTLPTESASRVFLLKARPGNKLPRHTHSDSELTLVLTGAFEHKGGRFAPGDLDDADGSIEHQPVVVSDDECICLVAMQGKLVLSGLVGRIIQPFVRF
jgi:putative transcriptional regulator